MADDKLSTSIQESIATAIALVDDDKSTLISNAVTPDLFDEPYDLIIDRCLNYRKTEKKAPGKSHIDDLFADIIEDTSHKKHAIILRLLNGMVRQVEGLNTNFVAARVTDFVQLKQIRAGIAETVDRYQKGGTGTVEDLETIMRKTLRIRTNPDKDYGFTLGDSRALNFLERSDADFCKIGIKELDDHGVNPARQEMLLFLAARNRGKSQWLIHCGKFGLLKGWKIAHYTLENSDDMTAQRYFQSLFSGVRRPDNYHYSSFFEENDQTGLRTHKLKPNFIIEDKEETLKFLRKKMKGDEYSTIQEKLHNLRIRRFPTKQLSFEGLLRDLDELELLYHFRPDMILLDMPQLMKVDKRREGYEALDDLTGELRGLAVERNLAMVIPQQGNRAAESTGSVQGHHGSGSIGMLGITDNAITYSQTASEEQHGLARLFAQKVRNDTARFMVVITQHYASGQFCMDSRFMTNEIRDVVKNHVGYKPGEEEEGDDDMEPSRRAGGRR